MRSQDWHKYAIDTIKRIKEDRHTSPLGLFSTPEEYLVTLEEFTKLIYKLNQVPEGVIDDFYEMKKSFEIFKDHLDLYCGTLLKEIENDDDSTKN
jgi:hypothetical protein